MRDRLVTRTSSIALMLTIGALGGPAAATTTTPPPDTSFLRAQAEAALLAAFPDSTGVACAVPPADQAGVQFLCYATAADGSVIARLATVNDDGGIQFSDSAGGVATTTTVPAQPPITGSGSDTVTVTAFSGPTIIAVTHDGTGEFAVQPQRGGVAVGPPIAATGAVSGRFLAGLEGRVETLAVTADGAWTIQVEPISTAIPLAADTPASGSGPDVVRFAATAATPATISFEGAGPFSVSAVTSAGSQALVAQTGPYDAEVTLPAGPGFLAVNGTGAWSIALGSAATTDTAVG
jgi:hypothetical protein